jgi:nucleotide-binding universal stress UspA family protein
MTGIVIGTDGSPSAAAALRWGAREGKARGLPVTALMAWDYLGQEGGFDPGYNEMAAKERLTAAVEAALGDTGTTGVDIGMKVVNDLPARALLAASQEADLVVVGARGLGGFRRLALGSVSDQVLHYSGCPVAIVRPSADELAGRPERIVVGLDGSEGSQAAFRWALDEARARQAPVRLLHAWQPAIVGGDKFLPTRPDADAMAEVARHLVDAAVAAEDTEGVTVEQVEVRGAVTEAMLGEAADASLVVVGSRGRGGFAGLLLGSVSQQLARHSATPVVVVPHHA